MTDAADDLLDGMCDLDFEVLYPTTDEQAPYVVLFADMIGPEQTPTVGPSELAVRAGEWRALFARSVAHGP